GATDEQSTAHNYTSAAVALWTSVYFVPFLHGKLRQNVIEHFRVFGRVFEANSKMLQIPTLFAAIRSLFHSKVKELAVNCLKNRAKRPHSYPNLPQKTCLLIGYSNPFSTVNATFSSARFFRYFA